ncbi:MAG: hypothetical protein D8M54_21785 [Chloroflexi bacterium]|nr:hypothetical protein [Chloroflexota bacterium]
MTVWLNSIGQPKLIFRNKCPFQRKYQVLVKQIHQLVWFIFGLMGLMGLQVIGQRGFGEVLKY